MALRPNRPQTRSEQLAERQSAEQDVLLREIDEAVRQDEMANFARRFGKPLLAVVGIGLLAFGGYLIWHEQREAGLEEQSEQLVRALDQIEAGHLDTGGKALAPLVSDGGSGSATAARLLQAGVAMQQGRKDEGVRIFAAVANDKAAPKAYRDLAAIREVAANFDAMKPEDVVARLKPLAVPGNPWFGSAGELVGIAYLKQNKPELAGPLFASIAKAGDVPDTLRARARQMAGLLGVDAVVDADQIAPVQNDAGAGATAE